ncbi:Tyrosine-protein kinase etk [Hartmannibacter diazotrophicus]|uniref:non-specific protein-tyrosine kinase n=1 Tax=Hartmannibacter diazotrophicus TaxID=1482074 RepID=A0A2C9DCK6_9HYPH|nr:polysaccharide biosynthesis tyrosine autokinase [Hartmannibacter diazotrophicus]SON58054.1 Tyrosine-protein kinase etk [Hartmannibacter diazotrophicus]
MLRQLNKSPLSGKSFRLIDNTVRTDELFDRIWAAVRRQILALILIVVFFVGMGGLYLYFAEPSYTSESYLLIDTRRVAGMEDNTAGATDVVDDSMVDSQVEVILSENSILKVIDKLDLINDPAFSRDRPGFFARAYNQLLGNVFGSSGASDDGSASSASAGDAAPSDNAGAASPAAGQPAPTDGAGAMPSKIAAAGATPGSSPTAEGVPGEAAPGTPAMAPAGDNAQTAGAQPAAGADATADPDFLRKRLVLEQLLGNIKVQRIGRTYVLTISFTAVDPVVAANVANAVADQYLTDQLESKYEATQRAGDWLQDRIKELRERSIAADNTVQKYRADHGLISANGVLVNEQQLGEINTELVKSRAVTAQSEARYRRIKDIIDTKAMDAAVTESIDSPVIVDLRTKFLDTARRRQDIARRIGEDSEATKAMDRQMDDYRRLIFEELGRIAESYRSDLNIAKANEQSLEKNLQDMVNLNAATNETQVQLRELERESETYRNIYTTFLQRYQETIQQQSFPITEARIITRAVPSQKPSAPNPNLVLAAAMMLGLFVGGVVTSYREYADRVFRTGSQIRAELGTEFFGMLWKVKRRRLLINRMKDTDGRRLLRPASSVYEQAAENPLAASTETLRSIKIAADLAFHSHVAKTIGVVSALPGEGKTVVSKNFASLVATTGAKTLLIDCDMRNPGLTRAVAGHAEEGLVEAIAEGRPVQELIYEEDKTGLHVLPCVARKRLFHTSELLSSKAMTDILNWARDNYDYVILDLSPLGPVVDVRVIEPEIDGFVFVVAWGETPRRIVRSIINGEKDIAAKCLGVLLNKVDPKRGQAYQSIEDKERYMRRYTNYYVDQ